MKLVDWWWNLQSGLENSLLTLEPDVLRPSDEATQVPLGLDILADAKVPKMNKRRILKTGSQKVNGLALSSCITWCASQRVG